MKSNINGSCGRKGCDTDRIILPWDGRTIFIRSRVYEGRNDIKLVRKVNKLALGFNKVS